MAGRVRDAWCDFEHQLAAHGTIVQKFWLHIDADEQLRRFRAREQTPFKKYKITAEDYRNRERRAEYAAAATDMIHRTHRDRAPWSVIAANDKKFARIEVMKRYRVALRARV